MLLLAKKKRGTGYAIHFGPSEPANINHFSISAYLAIILLII